MLLTHSNGEVKGVSLNSSNAARKRTGPPPGTVTGVGRQPLAADGSPLQTPSAAPGLWLAGGDAVSFSRFPIALIGDPALTFNSCKIHLLKTKVFCNSSVTPVMFLLYTCLHLLKNTKNIGLVRQLENKLLF